MSDKTTGTPTVPVERNQKEHRIHAIRSNLEWLEEHGEDGDFETAKRLGMIRGDAIALGRLYEE